LSTRILIVDDGSSSVDLQEALVQGMEDRQIAPGDAADAVMDDFRPDVVVINCDCDGGMDFISHIRENENWAATTVVGVSSNPSNDHCNEAYELGVDDFVAPVHVNELRWKLRCWPRFSRIVDLNVAQDEFLEIMRHEDYSPLGVIVQVGRTLRKVDAFKEVPELYELIKGLDSTSERMAAHVDLLLQYEAWHSGTAECQIGNWQVQDLLRTQLANWYDQADEWELEFELVEPLVEAILPVDLDSCKRVVRWVVNNALQHARKTVRMKTGKHGTDWIYIDVTDDGAGFDERVKDIVFSLFQVGTVIPEGVDIGSHLSLSRTILARQGGVISILDPGPDKTTVRIVLPILTE
jgi:signal transduction histidine kinase